MQKSCILLWLYHWIILSGTSTFLFLQMYSTVGIHFKALKSHYLKCTNTYKAEKGNAKVTHRNAVTVGPVLCTFIRKLSPVCDFSLGAGIFISSVTHGPSSIVWRHVTVSQEFIWMASFIWVQPVQVVTPWKTLILYILAVNRWWY